MNEWMKKTISLYIDKVFCKAMMTNKNVLSVQIDAYTRETKKKRQGHECVIQAFANATLKSSSYTNML